MRTRSGAILTGMKLSHRTAVVLIKLAVKHSRAKDWSMDQAQFQRLKKYPPKYPHYVTVLKALRILRAEMPEVDDTLAELVDLFSGEDRSSLPVFDPPKHPGPRSSILRGDARPRDQSLATGPPVSHRPGPEENPVLMRPQGSASRLNIKKPPG